MLSVSRGCMHFLCYVDDFSSKILDSQLSLFRYYFSKNVKNRFIFVSHTIQLNFSYVWPSKLKILLTTFNPAKSRTRCYLFFWYYFSKSVKNRFIFVSHTIRLYFSYVWPSKMNTLLPTFDPAKSRTRKRDLFTSRKEVSKY